MFIVGKCRLNEILEEIGWTQVQLADRVGMKKQQIGAYATNESIMSMKTAKNIAHAVNRSIDELYDFIWIDQ